MVGLRRLRYVDELQGKASDALIFTATVGRAGAGPGDQLRFDENGLVSEFTVMARRRPAGSPSPRRWDRESLQLPRNSRLSGRQDRLDFISTSSSPSARRRQIFRVGDFGDAAGAQTRRRSARSSYYEPVHGHPQVRRDRLEHGNDVRQGDEQHHPGWPRPRRCDSVVSGRDDGGDQGASHEERASTTPKYLLDAAASQPGPCRSCRRRPHQREEGEAEHDPQRAIDGQLVGSR